jgi:hypothetical protein
MENNRTVPGIGPGAWDSAILAREQERKALNTAIVYRLYTEDVAQDGNSGTSALIARYFAGSTTYAATGRWLDAIEYGLVIEIVATKGDLQAIVNLAGDIKTQNYQSSVLVTWAPVSRLDV